MKCQFVWYKHFLTVELPGSLYKIIKKTSHNPIKMCIATNSAILTTASKLKNTVPAFKFYRIAVVHILYQNYGFNSSFEEVLF